MKQLFRFFFLAFLLPIISTAQNDDTKVWKLVDRMPQFPGGDVELMRYLSTNIKYPHHESENNIQGKVYTNFVIDTNGKVKDIKILKGVANGEGLSAEAIRVIGAMPNWIPGEQNGKKVSVEMMLPINFAIEVKADVYVPPTYPGGTDFLTTKIANATKSILNNDEGLILVSMRVDTNGNVSNITEVRKLKLNTLMNEKTKEAFTDMKFAPATLNGIPIDTNVGFNIFISNTKQIIIEYSFDSKDSLRSIKELAYIQGVVNSELKNYDRAIALYAIAKHFGNNTKDLYFNLGSAYLNTNNPKLACENWLKAVKLGDKEAATLILQNCPDLADQKGLTFEAIDLLDDTLLLVEKSNESIVIYSVAEVMPKFPGGEDGFLKFIAMNFHYPDYEMNRSIVGKVYVEFVIRPDGSVTDVKVLRGIAGGSGLDKEAVRVVSLSPKWTPGMQNGKAVAVYYRVPVTCKLVNPK